MPRPLIIDCDPGVDDAIAILLACCALDRFDILGITTVAGNVPLSLTQTNARKLVEFANCAHIPVFAGCPRPLLQPLTTATEIHGATGLQGALLPDPTQPLQPQHGVAFLIETLLQAPTPITLATLGPLTNLAAALIQAPDIANQIQEVVIMGGAITRGNITPCAEFNLFVDPHAAQVVLDAQLPCTWITLDITHQLLTTTRQIEALRQLNTPLGQVAADLLLHYGKIDIERDHLPGAPLHDPCVIAYLLWPELFTQRAAHMAIELHGSHTLGRTVIDWHPVAPTQANAQVVDSINASEVYQRIIAQLALR
jgi:purine nucleosidase